MKKIQTVTVEMLTRKGACPEQVELFRCLFGASVKVTLKGCVKAAQQFDWDWAARKLLSATAVKIYQEATATAVKIYQEATAPAWKAYEEAMAPAWKAYKEATDPALKAYKEARAPAWKAYEEARAPALKAYEEARATAFARCVKEWGITE